FHDGRLVGSRLERRELVFVPGQQQVRGSAALALRQAGCWIDAVVHETSLSGTTTVSPGLTRSVSLTLSSRFVPSTTRTTATRFVAPFGMTPPARESNCRTVVSDWTGYDPGFLTCPKTKASWARGI